MRRGTALLGALLALVLAGSGRADAFTPNTKQDVVGASGCAPVLCTPRSAIAAAAANGGRARRAPRRC